MHLYIQEIFLQLQKQLQASSFQKAKYLCLFFQTRLCFETISVFVPHKHSYLRCGIWSFHAASVQLLPIYIITDLPTRPYLPVLVRKSAGSTPIFLRIQTQSFQKVRKSRRERCEFVASEADRKVLIGSYRSLTFAYFKPFQGL